MVSSHQQPNLALDAFWTGSDAYVIGLDDVADFNPENILPKSDAVQNSLRKSLKPTQYAGDGSEYQAHSTSHHAGTGAWLFDSNTYREWHGSAEHGILWIRGIPGSGKSVLASRLISHHAHHEAAPVLYFFFRHTFDAQNTPEALLRDWLAQVLKYSPPLQHALSQDSRGDMAGEDLWRLLRRALMYLPKVYCIVDALDEMSSEHLGPFLRQLDALGRWRPAEIKLVVSSRPLASIESMFSRHVKTLDVRMDQPRVQDDIARYVNSRVSETALPPGQHGDVSSAVISRADGLFLYAKLALDSICKDTSTPMDGRLANIPQDLTQIYTSLLRDNTRKLQGAPDDFQETVLQLVTHAVRPLRLLEVADIVHFIHPHIGLGAIKDHVRSLCGPLLELLPDETIRIVHHSLTEYLKDATATRTPPDRLFPVFDPATTHHRLACLCLSYLCSGYLAKVEYTPRGKGAGDFKYAQPARLEKNQLTSPFTVYAASSWYFHVRKCTLAGCDPTEIHGLLDAVLVEPIMDRIEVFAKRDMGLEPSHLHLAIGLGLCGYAGHLLSERKLQCFEDGALKGTYILYAAAVGNEDMVRLLIDHGADMTVLDRRGRTPLHLAVEHHNSAAVAVLLDAGADPESPRVEDDYSSTYEEGVPPWTPLIHAFSRGRVATAKAFADGLKGPRVVASAVFQAVSACNRHLVELLSQHAEFDVNRPHDHVVPLLAACGTRQIEMVELLIRLGASMETGGQDDQVKDRAGGTLKYRLQAVPEFEDPDLEVVGPDTATDQGAPEDAGERRYTNTLHAWAGGPGPQGQAARFPAGQADSARAIRMLVECGARVDQVNRDGKTPLQLARDVSTVRCLLEAGADPNVVNSAGMSLLHETQNPEIIDVLIPRANLELKTRRTARTPLLSCLIDSYGRDAVRLDKAMRLVDGGADIFAVDKYGNSALHLALGEGVDALALVKKLCSMGADVRLRNYQGKSPLHMNAPGSGRVCWMGWDSGKLTAEFLPVLLTAGADIDARDDGGRTVLFQLMESTSRDAMVRDCDRLLAHGAQIGTTDSRGRTLLHAFMYSRSGPISDLQYLIDRGADPSAVDDDGNSLLHEAAPGLAKTPYDGASRNLVDFCSDVGLDLMASNRFGRLPLHALVSYSPGSLDPSDSNQGEPCGFDGCLRRTALAMDHPDKAGVRPLHIASTFSEYLTRRLLEEGADPVGPTEEGLTPLHLAARSQRANIVGMLLDKMSEALEPDRFAAAINARDEMRRTPLYYAAASGRVETFQLLVDGGAEMNHGEFIGSAWQGCAHFEQELTRWKPLVTNGWRVERKDHKRIKRNAGGVLLAESPQPDPVRLRHFGPDPIPPGRLEEILELMVPRAAEGQLPHLAQAISSSAEQGHDYAVACLVAAKSLMTGDCDVADGNTESCLERRRELTDGVSTWDAAAMTRLMHTRQYGRVPRFLGKGIHEGGAVSRAAVQFVLQLVSGGFAALVSRAASPRVLQRFASLCETPLTISACKRRTPNMAVLKVLVEDKQLDVNACTPVGSDQDKPRRGITALHVLAGGGHWWQHKQAIPYLVAHGADINAVEDKCNMTPLGYALRTIKGPRFSRETVETLLALGASPNGRDRKGRTYLSWTVEHPDMFKLLVRHGAVIGRSALQAAMQLGDVDLAEMMLAHGADPNERKAGKQRPEVQTSENRFTMSRSDPSSTEETYLLHWLATTSSGEVKEDTKRQFMQMLLDRGANPLARYAQRTMLHHILERHVPDLSASVNSFVKVCLGRPGLDLEARDADGRTLLLAAARRTVSSDESVPAVYQTLLDLGANASARDNAGQNVLHLAVKSPGRLDFFLGHVPHLIDSPDGRGKTPLHLALGDSSTAEGVFDVLMTAGADATRSDDDGLTPLHNALSGSSWRIKADGTVSGRGRSVLDALVSKGADVNARANSGETPIFGYLWSSDMRAEVDTSDLGPRPPKLGKYNERSWIWDMMLRERAAAVESEGVIWDTLCQYGVDLSVVDNAGQGLLHVIAQKDRVVGTDSFSGRGARQFKMLMERGLDPAMEDAQHRTPLDLASACGRLDLLDLFKERGCEAVGDAHGDGA